VYNVMKSLTTKSLSKSRVAFKKFSRTCTQPGVTASPDRPQDSSLLFLIWLTLLIVTVPNTVSAMQSQIHTVTGQPPK
jgi:hypothetical protein